MSELEVRDYIKLVAVLLGAIMAVQSVSAARSRTYAIWLLVTFGTLVGGTLMSGALRPPGLSAGDFDKILATVGMWVVATGVIELTPIAESKRADGE